VLVTLVNVSLLLVALRDWQVYRLSGIAAALPVLPGTAGLLILVAVAVRTGQAGSRLPGLADRPGPVPQVNRDDDRFWKGGLIYINRDDPAIMVGNRFGIGWTPNLGNPRACLLYAGRSRAHRPSGRTQMPRSCMSSICLTITSWRYWSWSYGARSR